MAAGTILVACSWACSWASSSACLSGCAPSRPAPAAAGAPPPPPALVPAPSKIATCAAPPLKITWSSRVSGPRDVASRLEEWLGLPPSAIGDPADIELRLLAPDTTDPALELPSIEAQSFTLDVDGARAVVTSRGRAGLFYGAQTIAQLAGARLVSGSTVRAAPIGAREWELPCVHIEDRPRSMFRAMHLDVARHFFDRETVERYVDLLSFYRFNVFHWHLTDDQGFRLQLPSHPELASPDASYPRSDVIGVVAAARERFVTVVPEIEMPGHSRAILAAHPELSCTGEQQTTPRSWGIFEDVLCAGNPGSLALVKDVLDDVARLFPSRLIHVGGDEVPPARWNACPKCQAAMKAAHVDAVGLEHVFMSQVFAHLATLKRKPMVWDEALPDAPPASMPNAPIVVAWQSKARGDLATARGFDAVYAPYEDVYFNFGQSGIADLEPGHVGHLTWERVRAFDPGTGPHVLGAEGTLWTEYVWSRDDIDQLVMPRMAALADALWSGPRHDFAQRFTAPAHVGLLDRSGVKYFIHPPLGLRPRRVVTDSAEAWMKLEPPTLFREGTIRYTRDGTIPTASAPRYRDPLQITDATTITAALFLPNGRSSDPVRTRFVKEIPRPAVAPDQEGVTCTYYDGHFHRLAQIGGAPRATLTHARIDIDYLQQAAGATSPEHFGFRCTGYIEVARTGVHRFIVTSDDGARLSIDGERLVDIDGELGAREADADIALARGPHRIEVLYFQGTEGKELRLEVEDPAGKRGPLEYAK